MQKWLLIILVCLAGHPASAQYDSAFLAPYPLRFQLLEEVPLKGNYYVTDTALQSFARLRQLAEAHNDPKAVLISRLMDYYYMAGQPSFTFSTAIKTRDSLIQTARQLHFPAAEASAQIKFGNYCYQHHWYVESFTAYFAAYDVYKDLDVHEFYAKAYTLYSLAESYYRFNDYNHAIFYGRQALLTPDPQGWTHLYSSDLLGMVMLKTGRPDSAEWYFNLTYKAALQITPGNGRTGWLGIAAGNRGLCREAQGADAAAIPLLRTGIDSTARQYYWGNNCIFQIHLARIYLKQGQSAEAAALLEPARIATAKDGDEDARAQLYQLLADYNKLKGNTLAALTYRDSSIYWTDSIGRRLDKNIQTRAELAYVEGRHQAQVLQLNSRLKLQRLEVYGLLALLLLGGIIGYLLVRGRRQHVLLLQAKAERAKAALSRAQERLRQITESVQEKNALIERMEDLPAPTPVAALQHKELLEGLRNSVILTKAGWVDFQQVFELVYPGFIAQQEQEFPSLTASEVRLLVLDKLGLTNKEMAAMLGVSQETIRSTRSRLRKKTDRTDTPGDGAAA